LVRLEIFLLKIDATGVILLFLYYRLCRNERTRSRTCRSN